MLAARDAVPRLALGDPLSRNRDVHPVRIQPPAIRQLKAGLEDVWDIGVQHPQAESAQALQLPRPASCRSRQG